MGHEPENEALRVCVRVRPDSLSTVWKIEESNIKDVSTSGKTFSYDQVFSESACNADVYMHMVQPLVHSFTAGFNATVFAFGQTSSGKTHTIFGHGNEPGVVYCILNDIFDHIQRNPSSSFVMLVSYLEVYNECVNDLLSGQEGLQIREGSNGVFVQGVCEKVISNLEDAIKWLEQGNRTKTMGNSHLNNKSSRSHTIFKILLASEVDNRFSVSELNLCDLAGSEALTDAFGSTQQQETKNINLSLGYLKRVISALANGDAHIPYRSSQLTRLLQNSLGGNAKTALICTVSLNEEHRGQTTRTLSFGTTAKTVKNSICANYYDSSAQTRVTLKEHIDVTEVTVDVHALMASKVKAAKSKSPNDELEELHLVCTCGTVVALAAGPVDGSVVVLLHGFGKVSEDEWRYLFAPLAQAGYRVVLPHFPGFGRSAGTRPSSRTELHCAPGGSADILHDVLLQLGVSRRRPAVMVGYDWGAGVALCYCSDRRVPVGMVSRVVAFHASWTTDLAVLNTLTVPVLVLWVPVDQLHPFSQATKITKAIPKSSLVKLSVGRFHSDVPKGTYAAIGSQITSRVLEFLGQPLQRPRRPSATKQAAKSDSSPGSAHATTTEIAAAATTVLAAAEGAADDQGSITTAAATATTEAAAAPSKETASTELSTARSAGLSGKSGKEAASEIAVRSATMPGEEPGRDMANLLGRASESRPGAFERLWAALHECSRVLEREPVAAASHTKTVQPPVIGSPGPGIHPQRWAVQTFLELLQRRQAPTVLAALPFAGPLHPDALRLCSQLPLLPPHAPLLAFSESGLWPVLPRGAALLAECARYLPGRQVTVPLTVEHSVVAQAGASYLSYNVGGPRLLTHRAFLAEYTPGSWTVLAQDASGLCHTRVSVPETDVYVWNQATHFRSLSDNEGGSACTLVFDDNIKCRYSDALTKAKINEAALAVAPLVACMDFEAALAAQAAPTAATPQRDDSQSPAARLLELQCACVETIWQTLDLQHIVHCGKEASRACVPDVGRLAHHGQWHCHGLASVMAAVLLPFSTVLGIDVKFREGAVLKTGRELDEHRCPLPGWDGCIRQVNDHTWLELMFVPSLVTVVCDPSTNELILPLEPAYTGLRCRHPQGTVAGALPVKLPQMQPIIDAQQQQKSLLPLVVPYAACAGTPDPLPPYDWRKWKYPSGTA